MPSIDVFVGPKENMGRRDKPGDDDKSNDQNRTEHALAPKPRGSEIGFTETVFADRLRQALAGRERGRCQAHRVGGLNAVAALTGEPEEARSVRSEADHGILVADEAP